MAEDSLKSYTSYAKTVKRISMMSGLWPVEKPNIFYRLLPYSIGMALLINACVTMNFTYVNIHNLNRMVRGMSISLSSLNALVKVICYIVHREEVAELKCTIDKLLRWQQHDVQLLSPMLSATMFFKVVSSLLILSTIVVLAIYSITPVIMIIYQHHRGITPILYSLPYPSVYPYTIVGGSGLYILHYAMECWACFAMFSSICGVDNLFGLRSSQIIGQLRGLAYRMKNYTFTTGYKKDLQEMMEIHCNLMQCCKLLQTIYGPIVLSLFGTTAIILCSLIFQISQMKTISPKQMLFIIFYISAKLLQTITFAGAGHLIIAECDNLRNEVYGTGWENLGEKSSAYYIRIILMQKAIQMKACSCVPISLNLITGILNTTLSYYFLLRTLDNK